MQHLPKSRNTSSYISTVSLVNQEHSEQHQQFLKTIDRLDIRVSWIIKRLLPLNIPDGFNGWAWLSTITEEEILHVHAVGPKRAELAFHTIQTLLTVSATTGEVTASEKALGVFVDRDLEQLIEHAHSLPRIPFEILSENMQALLIRLALFTEQSDISLGEIIQEFFPATLDKNSAAVRHLPNGSIIRLLFLPEVRKWLREQSALPDPHPQRFEIAAKIVLLALATDARWHPWILSETFQCDGADLRALLPHIQPQLSRKDMRRFSDYFSDLDVATAYVNGQSFNQLGASEGTTGEAVRRRLGRMGLTSAVAREIRRASDDNRMNEDHPEFAVTKERINSFVIAHPGCTLEEITEYLGWDVEPARSLLRDIEHLILGDVKPNAQHIRALERQIAAAVTSLQQAADYYSPLTGPIYDQLVRDGKIRGVSSQRMFQLFGTWTAACEAAGIEFRGTPDRDYERRWTDEDVLEWVSDYFLDLEFRGASHRYDEWRKQHQDRDDIPSAGSIRNYLSRSWDEVGILTLQQLRSTWN